MKSLHWYILFLSVAVFASCNRKVEEISGPTIGQINILADEGLRELVSQQEEVFERLYTYAKLDIDYAPEFDVVSKFIQDSVDVIITYHKLNDEELAYFKQKASYPREFEFATGAIAFIVNRESADTLYTYEELTGEILRLLDQSELPEHFYALDTKAEVLDYIASQDNAIGLIDYTDISDSDSAYTKEVLAKFRLLGITRPIDSLQVGHVQPWQYNLQDRKYPFTRDIYITTKTGKSDVSIGFASFICEEKGQRIVLKAGLLPKYQTERNIEIKTITDIKVVK
jgi:phosphate transport system substrate-binding protein